MAAPGDIDAVVFERRAGRLRVRGVELALDPPHPAPVAVITHAHADHVAAHGRAIVTAETAAVLRARGYDGALDVVALHTPFAVGDATVELLPAGHAPGAALVRVTRADRVGVYTGDLGRAADPWLGAPAAVECDELVVDGTGGAAHRRFPPIADALAQLMGAVVDALQADATPVVFADAFGRAQRVALALRGRGFDVRATPAVHRVHRALAPWWPALGEVGLLARTLPEGSVVQMARGALFAKTRTFVRQVRIACAGATGGLAEALPVDVVVPLVDHGEHAETVAWVEATGARRVFVMPPHAAALADAVRTPTRHAEPFAPEAT